MANYSTKANSMIFHIYRGSLTGHRQTGKPTSEWKHATVATTSAQRKQMHSPKRARTQADVTSVSSIKHSVVTEKKPASALAKPELLAKNQWGEQWAQRLHWHTHTYINTWCSYTGQCLSRHHIQMLHLDHYWSFPSPPTIASSNSTLSSVIQIYIYNTWCMYIYMSSGVGRLELRILFTCL